MKYQEQFLTIWDTPTQATDNNAQKRTSFFKSLALMLVALKR